MSEQERFDDDKKEEVLVEAPFSPTAASVLNEPVVQSEAAERMAQAVNMHSDGAEKKRRPLSSRGVIAVALICSLLGGMIGSMVTNRINGNSSLSIPQGSAPISVVGGEVSPVIAIADAVSPSIVGVSTYGTVQTWFGSQGVGKLGSGSGIIFREDGYIITNNHVVSGGTSFDVTLQDGTIYEAKLVGTDSATDLAVLKVEAKGLPAASLGDSDELKIGELAVAIGNPLGYNNTVTDGIISGLNRQSMTGYEQELSLIQTNAAINSGNSGGALVNSRGEVVGICSVKLASTDIEGMGFAISINEAKPILEELMNKGYVSRPYMGISGGTVTEELAAYYELPLKQGVFIDKIVADSPAQKAGLQPGDIIYKVNDTIINSWEDLNEILDQSKVGDKLRLLVDRNGNKVEIYVTLGEASAEARNRQ